MNITKLSDDIVKNGIKEIWPLEEKDFSPWVANNLQDIEEIIGKHIQSYELEKSCGRYESDIVATTDEGETVIIENKLGTFDHDHFGKALTYMSYFRAKTIVWICDKYYEEHIKAINQLNDMTSDEYTFYALDLKLFKHDKDNIKYEYHISAQPDYVIKRINANVPHQEVNETIVDFYNNIYDELNSKNIRFAFDKRGKGYGWTSIKTKLGNKLNLLIYVSQRNKTVHCGIENGTEELYNKAIEEFARIYPDYKFEQTVGAKNKSLIRMPLLNKLSWKSTPQEQYNEIMNMFFNLYNVIKDSDNL